MSGFVGWGVSHWRLLALAAFGLAMATAVVWGATNGFDRLLDKAPDWVDPGPGGLDQRDESRQAAVDAAVRAWWGER